MRRDVLLLCEMRDAASAIQHLVADRRGDDISADMTRRAALLWHFTVLGEAASQVDPASKASHPEIAWHAATRLRNRIVHGYWDIDIDMLLATADQDLPAMKADLERVIATIREAGE